MITPVYFFSKIVDFILRHKRFFIFVVLVFFIVVGMSTLCRGGIGPPPRRTDLTVFLRGAEAILSGEDIYAVTNARGWHYVYMPLLAILLAPFARLPLLANTSLWYLLSVAAICWTVILSVRLAEDRRTGMRAAMLALIFCIPSLVETLTRGQVGALNVFLAIAILYLYARGWAVWAGVLFAFAVVLKPSPTAFIFLFFLVKREWKACAAAVLGVIFFVLAFPSLVIGADRNWLFLTEWNKILSYAVSSGAGEESRLWNQLATPIAWDNQSLYAVFTRWACPTESALIACGDFWQRWGVRVFGVAALSILAFVCGRKKPRTSGKRLILEYSLFLILMLLVSPVSEIHHFTVFFLLFFAVFLYLDELPRNSAAYQWLGWGVFIAALTQIFGYIEPLNLWGLPALGALLIWCASFVFLSRQPGLKLKT